MSASATFPYNSKFMKVNNHKLHYIDEGDGQVVIFLHGVPTWSYLWRHILPAIAKHHRTISVDLLGFGKSDKVDGMDYTIDQHIDYIEQFIDKLKLDKFTLVMHGWGSVIGSHIAMSKLGRCQGLVFIESHIRPNDDISKLSLPVRELFYKLEQKQDQEAYVLSSNAALEEFLLSGTIHKLTEQQLQQYLAPFSDEAARKPLLQYLKEVPRGQKEGRALEIIANYSTLLCKSQLPKLLLYALPGFATTMETVIWAKNHLANLRVVELGEAYHFPQETLPTEISEAILFWLENDVVRAHD